MVHVRWKLQNNTHQCAVPRCKGPIGPNYLGLDICWRCFGRHCDTNFLKRYARDGFSKIYVAGRYFRGGQLLVRGDMGLIKLGDRVKMDPENSGAYSEFLKKGEGEIIGIHPMGRKDLSRTVKSCPMKKVGHLTVRCDNGIVIVIGPSRLAEINGFKRPDLRRKPKRKKITKRGKILSLRRNIRRRDVDDLWD